MNNTHPYLRAYMAGSVVPTLFLLVIISAFILVRLVMHFPEPIERGIIFPMAFVPNLFGLWNLIYVWRKPHGHLPIGFHGMLLPCILLPSGLIIGRLLEIFHFTGAGLTFFSLAIAPYGFIAVGFGCALIAYYLVWKYFVGYLNGVLGIA